MQQLLKNYQLAVAVEMHLHPDLRARLHTLRDIVTVFEANSHDPVGTLTSLHRKQLAALVWLQRCKVAAGVYNLPLLSPTFCEMIRTETADWPFTGNSQEPEHLRCPEAVLHEVCPQLGRTVWELFRAALGPVYTLIHGTVPTAVAAAQLTRYTLQRNSLGGWHQDEDSDFTAVVELAPELHIGGGTDVMSAPLTVTSVPTLAKGHALLFCGKTTHHRGRPITEGVRDLLVYWTEAK
jgi:hypothetical protein